MLKTRFAISIFKRQAKNRSIAEKPMRNSLLANCQSRRLVSEESTYNVCGYLSFDDGERLILEGQVSCLNYLFPHCIMTKYQNDYH